MSYHQLFQRGRPAQPAFLKPTHTHLWNGNGVKGNRLRSYRNVALWLWNLFGQISAITNYYFYHLHFQAFMWICAGVFKTNEDVWWVKLVIGMGTCSKPLLQSPHVHFSPDSYVWSYNGKSIWLDIYSGLAHSHIGHGPTFDLHFTSWLR